MTKLMKDWVEVYEIINDPEKVSRELFLIASRFLVGSP